MLLNKRPWGFVRDMAKASLSLDCCPLSLIVVDWLRQPAECSSLRSLAIYICVHMSIEKRVKLNLSPVRWLAHFVGALAVCSLPFFRKPLPCGALLLCSTCSMGDSGRLRLL